jgi:hypothetical protein
VRNLSNNCGIDQPFRYDSALVLLFIRKCLLKGAIFIFMLTLSKKKTNSKKEKDSAKPKKLTKTIPEDLPPLQNILIVHSDDFGSKNKNKKG